MVVDTDISDSLPIGLSYTTKFRHISVIVKGACNLFENLSKPILAYNSKFLFMFLKQKIIIWNIINLILTQKLERIA
jgi:hypothetical protein